MAKDSEKLEKLVKEHASSLESLKALVERNADHNTILFQSKVIVSINEDILTEICGDIKWKPS